MTLGFMTFVVPVIGLHEFLHATGAALAQAGAVLSIIGTVMLSTAPSATSRSAARTG